MKKTLILLILISLCTFNEPVEVTAQTEISALTSIGYTGLDRDSGINTMHRNDDPFNPLRSTLFIESWLSEDIGVFLEFLWDAGAPPTGTQTKPRINGAYAVLSPFDAETVKFKVGLIPSPLGTWAPRTYADKNPLVGIPLMQHYMTSLPSDRLPLTADELYNSLGKNEDDFLSIAYDSCWPYGIELFGFFSKFEYALALTKESMSNPMAYTNDSAQLLGRLGVRPVIGLRLGISAEYGSYLPKGATGLPAGTKLEEVNQKAVACDMHYSIGHTHLYSEVIRNYWENPNLSKDLACTSWYVDIKQVLLPGLYAAVRLDQMIFDSIKNSNGTSFHWDNNITRVESGLGYHFNKDAMLKAVWQHNSVENEDDVDLACVQFVFTVGP